MSIEPAFSSQTVRRARAATRLQFAMLGVIAGVWGVHVPSIKATYQLDATRFSSVLLATSVGSLLTLFVAGRVVSRLGARATTVLAGAGFCLALGLALVMPGFVPLLAIMVLLGASESVYDVAINTEGTALEVLSGQPVMSGFHGMFSLGAMGGSALAALLLRLEVAPLHQLGVVAAGVVAVIVLASGRMLPTRPAAATGEASFAWPRGALLLIGVLILCGMLAEGVMYNWSVLYVQQELGTPQDRAALAYVSFAGATALMRFAGDAIRARVSERTMLVALPLLSAVTMLLVLLAAQPWVAIVGMGVVGAGLATIVPLLYNAATRVPGATRAASIAAVSSIGYLGFMLGPPLIGAVAQGASLTLAMGVLVVAALTLSAGARYVPTGERRRVSAGALRGDRATGGEATT
jgi:fucose permease